MPDDIDESVVGELELGDGVPVDDEFLLPLHAAIQTANVATARTHFTFFIIGFLFKKLLKMFNGGRYLRDLTYPFARYLSDSHRLLYLTLCLLLYRLNYGLNLRMQYRYYDNRHFDYCHRL